jgi:hypothetical protein
VDLALDGLRVGADGDPPLHLTLGTCSYTFPYAACPKWNPYKCGGIQCRLVQSGTVASVCLNLKCLTKLGNTLLYVALMGTEIQSVRNVGVHL